MACKKIILNFVEGDQETLRFEWEDTDLSLFSDIRLRLRRPDGSLRVLDATIIDPGPSPVGIFQFTLADDDLIEGSTSAEILTILTAGAVEDTFPDEDIMVFEVRARV